MSSGQGRRTKVTHLLSKAAAAGRASSPQEAVPHSCTGTGGFTVLAKSKSFTPKLLNSDNCLGQKSSFSHSRNHYKPSFDQCCLLVSLSTLAVFAKMLQEGVKSDLIAQVGAQQPFSVRGQAANRLCSHAASVAAAQLCCPRAQQPQTVLNQQVAVFP